MKKTYKMLIESICAVMLVALSVVTIIAYGDFRASEARILQFKDELNFMKKYNLGKIFLQAGVSRPGGDGG
jgi:hypothetical protein